MARSNRASIKKVSGNSMVPIAFKGGANTVREKSLIPNGGFSYIQNLRPKRPGFVKRAGQVKLHSTADSTNKVVSMFGFSKGAKTEIHTFAQMGDSDVLEATKNPPEITAGVFGSEAFSGTTSDVPASWGVINDMLLYSNGSDQHQIYPGNTSPVDKFIVYKDSGAIPTHPAHGEDYSVEVTDGVATTVAILDSLGTLAQFDAIYVKLPIPGKQLTITVTAANGSAAVMQGQYWNGAWTSLSGFADTTLSSGKSLAQTGNFTWTAPTDIIPNYQFGESGWWYRFSLSSGALDAEVEISEVSFEADWQDIVNVWDGLPVDIIEMQYYDASATAYKTFAATSIEIDSATSSDKFYFSSTDPIVGFYVGVADTPNTTASTTINAVYGWDGDSWVSVSNLDDGSNGLANSGWVTFDKLATVHPTEFNKTQYKAYWYYFTVDKTLNDDVVISMETMPYYDINEYGRVGVCNAVWKDRAIYSFTNYPHYLYVSALGTPMVLNGSDSTILRAGDGRNNRVTCIKKFYNELMVWQAERGADGGCLTLFEGYSPSTFGKLVLSTKIGTFSAKTAVVVDGVLTSTATDEKVKTVAYFLSRYGVYMSDGTTVESISDDIQNYFEPGDSNSIRRGYDNDHWMAYDGKYNVIRIGLVTGTSATVPNTFLVYDLVDRKWSFDSIAQPLSFVGEAEASSGNAPVIQVGGGTADGTMYLVNSGSNDVSTAIDAYATVELDVGGFEMWIKEFLLRLKVQSTGEVKITPSVNSVAQTAISLPMTQLLDSSETIRRHRVGTNLQGDHISLKFQNDTASESIYLEDAAVDMEIFTER